MEAAVTGPGVAFWNRSASQREKKESMMPTTNSALRPGIVGRGRPKGSINKTSAAAKVVIAEAAARLGGVDRLVAWVRADKKNEHVFWTSIYTKLLPLQVNAEVEAHEPITRIERIIVRPGDRDGSAAHHSG
jgi:hypothetical protein